MRGWRGEAEDAARLAMEEDKKPEKPLEGRVVQACSDKDTIAAFDEAAKVDAFDGRPVFRTHPHHWDLLIKTHNPETYGCTTCHGGEGAQTKGVMHRKFRHGEDDHHWNDPLTDEVTVMGKKFKGAFMQSKCDKCHAAAITLAEGPLLARGKEPVVDAGGWGSHPIEGYNNRPK